MKHPQNISIDEGDTIILECEALGLPVPQIAWFLNGSVLSTNSSLVEIISASKVEHEGLYRCEAKNPAGSVAASAVVTINKGLCQSETYVLVFFALGGKLTTYFDAFEIQQASTSSDSTT